MKVKTHLVSGAGNTFHIAYSNNWDFTAGSGSAWSASKMKNLAKTACEINKADGFIFLEKSSDAAAQYPAQYPAQYQWYFFNNDGSGAEMCGNATRCVGYYIKNILKSNADQWRLLTVAGPITIAFVAAEKSAEKFKITMTPARELKSDQGFYCDTGVPHLVLEKKDIRIDETLIFEARQLRELAEFGLRGTNITYVVLEDEISTVRAVSYERGVEGFTAACGTGAMAVALFNLIKRGVKQTQVEMPGGTLMLDLSDLSRPTMTGPAVLLGSYEYEISI